MGNRSAEQTTVASRQTIERHEQTIQNVAMVNAQPRVVVPAVGENERPELICNVQGTGAEM